MYRKKIKEVIKVEYTSVTDIQKLHGYLNYAAGVEPFGRPFLAALTIAISRRQQNEEVRVTKEMRTCLRIWDNILNSNVGLSFDFILGKLPRSPYDEFVDASTE